jgi:hypothetical protein
MMKRYREFSTRNANYRLDYIIHGLQTEFKNLEDCDGIIIESASHPYKYVNLSDILTNFQYIRKNLELEKPKPIFLCDLPVKKSLYNIGNLEYFFSLYSALETMIPWILLSGFLSFPPLIFLPILPYSFCVVKPGKLSAYSSLILFYSLFAYRSAVTAEKIESFIAPEISRRIKRKPYICIEYGASHSDIEVYLKHEKLRRAVIGFNKNILSSRILDKGYINKVLEIRHKNSPQPSEIVEKQIVNRGKEEGVPNWERILYEI